MEITNTYLQKLYKKAQRENKGEPEFLQAVFEMFASISLIIDDYPEIINHNVIPRLLAPDRIISFPIVWTNSSGETETHVGYRIQYNNTLGIYKGGIRFHPSVNVSIFKFLAFEQTFKNALTTLPMGGGKGGATFDPKNHSAEDVRLFSLAFGAKLAPYIGETIDIPAGDLNVGQKEVSYFVEAFQKVTGSYECAYTGKPLALGGALGRKEATGFGLIYFVEEALATHFHDSLRGKKILISGAGNVALHAALKAKEKGATIVGMSDSKGYLYNEAGLDLTVIQNLKDEQRTSLAEYLKQRPAMYETNPQHLWRHPCDIALPCATQNEIDAPIAQTLVNNNVMLVAEGANMPTTQKAIDILLASGVMYAPGKASNAGGVLVSGLEIKQAQTKRTFSFAEIDTTLQTIMRNIFTEIYTLAQQYDRPHDLLLGANITSFLKVALAIIKEKHHD